MGPGGRAAGGPFPALQDRGAVSRAWPGSVCDAGCSPRGLPASERPPGRVPEAEQNLELGFLNAVTKRQQLEGPAIIATNKHSLAAEEGEAAGGGSPHGTE